MRSNTTFHAVLCSIAACAAFTASPASAVQEPDQRPPAYARRDGPPPGTVGSRQDANGRPNRDAGPQGGDHRRADNDRRDNDRRDDNRRDNNWRGDDNRRDNNWRSDNRRNDQWRDQRGQWHARDGNGGGPQRGWYRGDRLPTEYRGRQYVVDDWRGHRLRRPPSGYHWVQSGGDYILAAIATGVIVDIILNH